MSRWRRASIRTRVTLAAVTAVLIVAALLGVAGNKRIHEQRYDGLDRQLDLAGATLGTVGQLIRSRNSVPTPAGALSITVRVDGVVTAHVGAELPAPRLPATGGAFGSVRSSVVANGDSYRANTFVINKATPWLPAGSMLTVALPSAPADREAARAQRRLWTALLLSVLGTAVLTWALTSLAVAPLRRLARQTEEISQNGKPAAEAITVGGPTEIQALATALRGLLERVDAEERTAAAALAASRDFNALAAHELRGPLTTLGTDIDVLDLLLAKEPGQVPTVLASAHRAHGRLRDTLLALERMAQGEVLTAADVADTDLNELAHQVLAEAQRRFPAVEFVGPGAATVNAVVFAPGIAMAILNGIVNAATHGDAHRVEVTISSAAPGSVAIRIDDDGIGIPATARARLFERFARGSESDFTGSGLGLALVAQQAAIHGGTAQLLDSPLGGTRLEILIRPVAHPHP